MRRTGPSVLVAAGLLGAGAGFVLDMVLTATGWPTFTPAVTLPILLLLLGGVVLALAIPVHRGARGRGVAVNPFRALRIALLAKASSVVGAAFAGAAGGLLAFLLTRPAVPSLGSMTTVVATVVCGVVLVAAGLVAEQLCTIRKDDDDEHPGDPRPGADAVDG